jgi:rhamnogalacturonyl hydrolase YesR
MGQRGEDFLTLAGDGAWCWFSDPRAVYHRGTAERLYLGYASSKGDVAVGSYDYRTGEVLSTVVSPELQKDDHIAPSLLFLPDGRLMVFFTKHNGGFYFTTSLRPEDISAFGDVRRIDMGDMQCYTQPVMLSGEGDRIYVFFRGGYDWKPSFVCSDDLGRSWSAPKVMVAKPGSPDSTRPYTKVASDGVSRIDFAFTDGHPRDEASNSIYYIRYERGAFYDAAGRVLGDTSSLPLDQNRVPRAYDGARTGVRAWIWDMATDEAGRPVLVYTTLPEESKHVYNYASWDGTVWNGRTICEGGGWFPRYEKKKEEREPEPHYSGGIALDHADPAVVYLSRPSGDVFEIERWETRDAGASWSHRIVTSGSDHDNVRPVAVRGLPPGTSPGLVWMINARYRHYTDFRTAIVGDRAAGGFSAAFRKPDVRAVMTKVADWQIENFPKSGHHELEWTSGALYAGVMAFALASEDRRYMDWLEGIGRKYRWQPFFRMYHADDICVSQMYIDMYRARKDSQMLIPTKARADWVLEHRSRSSLMLDSGDPSTQERWSWCDALFMAPPVYAKLGSVTGSERYLEFMDGEYHATYDLLFDKPEHLFYRDRTYFDKREANGRKVFWGRGNGWVMGGLVSILKELPPGSRYRPFYESLFREMAAKVLSAQDGAGFWHASLLDPGSYPNPETSSSGFFTFALAYGVNAGLLGKEEYLPAVRKAWSALVGSVSPDGKLGWVQPIGADPRKVDRSMTETYGVGAFLLAGSEVGRLSE